ncbi:hypothetical protein, conserved [Eimeria praecox]|uniref:Uncharacterized protein n=1 Tax=Eimeria praecox TaxID=51316 RepID=U6G9X0_9EIME|nr:hypothetical protein, conserved [Eimeria praecox]
MTNKHMEATHQVASNGGIPLDGSSGLEMGCNTAQPCPSASDTVSAQQPRVSRQGYRQLFFDCNLHLVLQQLLRKSRSRGVSKDPALASDDVPLEPHDDGTEPELTDTEVARLMRQHLNILVANQSATEAEVVEAAKILEERYLPAANASHATETEEQRQGEQSGSGIHHDSAVHAAGGKIKPSGAADAGRRSSQTHQTIFSPESQASDIEHNITGLPLSQTQDEQTTEPQRSSACPQDFSGDARFGSFQAEVHFADDCEMPRKKLCREMPGNA